MACFGSDTSQIMEALMLAGSRTRSRKRCGESELASPQSAVRVKRTRLSMRQETIAEEAPEVSCIHVDSDSEPERELSPALPVVLDFDDEVIFSPPEEVEAPVESPPKTVILDETVVHHALNEIVTHHPSFDVGEWHERLSRIRRKSYTSGIWTSKYSPLDCCSVLGNDGAMLRLKSWLLEWKLFIEKDDPEGTAQTKERQNKESKLEKSKLKADCRKAYIDQDSSDDDGEFQMPVPEEMPLTGFMAYGASGVGKSAAVHALAQEMGFTVLEINPASCKDGKQILTQTLEATQSHRISGETKSSLGFKNLFSKSSQSQPKEDEESRKAEEKKNTLILIDDADVLPEGEESLLSTLETMLRKTKRPIVFTVSGQSKIRLIQTENLEVGEVDFLRQSTSDVVCYVRLLCLIESVVLDQEMAVDLVKSVSGDLRAAINLVQFWASSPSRKFAAAERSSLSLAAVDSPPSFIQNGPDLFTSEKKPNTQAGQLVQNLVDTTIVLRRIVEDVVSGCEKNSAPDVAGMSQSRKVSEADEPKACAEEMFRLAEHQSAFAQLTHDSRKAVDCALVEHLPMAGTTEDANELPITTEDRFDSLANWSESSMGYTDVVKSFVGEKLEDQPSEYWSRDGEEVETGRSLLNKYGRRVPQVHVRGSHFGTDYWTFFRAIAEAEFLRREQEQITKRRRLRFYHYLGPNSMHLTDEFLTKLSYSIGEKPSEADSQPYSL
ncbi:hypothetical protein RvY_10239 [Ramazzottius varieornatus]|uniref:AAA+ ATPase domain-containing protein n=1 Tax=Ramazzottius varieornatus TaxID=947166 RepID=A0A1D1VC47_RAMVA|nr:hypothetical protein RvY_10239 [Ramazzottius varieornatus]